MTRQTRYLVVLAAALLAALLTREGGAIADLGIAAGSSLVFGQIVATGVVGTVTVTPGGSREVSGGALLGNGLMVAPATFTVTGEPNTAYSITLPDSAVLSSSSEEMTADTFRSLPSDTGTIGPGGSQVVSLGATLHVGASQRPAHYSGTFSVTVAYE
jgi:hypothetical protein